MTQVFKRHRNKNDYLATPSGLWVRDFGKSAVPVDINDLTAESEYTALTRNELENRDFNLPAIDGERIYAPNLLIVSDGYNFQSVLPALAGLSKKVTVIGVNRSLARWDAKVRMSYYLTNNPYQEALTCLPALSTYYPRCICSVRTNPDFIRRYLHRGGYVYRYTPPPTRTFRGASPTPLYAVDDYRNPVCAAVVLAHRFHAERVALVCCDDVFRDERPGAERLPNGMWLYKPQRTAHELIEANLYWLTHQPGRKVRVVNCSSGPEYNRVPYITPDSLTDFFG